MSEAHIGPPPGYKTIGMINSRQKMHMLIGQPLTYSFLCNSAIVEYWRLFHYWYVQDTSEVTCKHCINRSKAIRNL